MEMLNKYNHITSIDFITQLDYAYLKTFSFQRSKEFVHLEQRLTKVHEVLDRRYSRGKHLTAGELSRLEVLKVQLKPMQLIVDSDGKLHPSSRLTHTCYYKDSLSQKIRTILQTPANEVWEFMCGPVFRDAVVFYDAKHSIVSSLNICLGCSYMMSGPFTYVDADKVVYEMFTDLFLELGHEVNHDVSIRI